MRRAARAVQFWIRRLIHSIIEIIILFTATAVLIGLLLSFLEALWYIYLQTPVGIKYTTNPARSSVHVLTQLFQKDLFLFAIEIAVMALIACLVIGVACQALAVRRYFYIGRGLLNRFIWLMIFSAAAAFGLTHRCQIDLQLAFGVSIAPSLCLFSSCMNIAARLLPELTPFGIWEIFIRVKRFLVHPAVRDIPDSQANPYPLSRKNLNPPTANTVVPLAKTRGSERIRPRGSGVISN